MLHDVELWGNAGVVVATGVGKCPYVILDAHDYEVNLAKNLEGLGRRHLSDPSDKIGGSVPPTLDHALSLVSLFRSGGGQSAQPCPPLPSSHS